MNALLVVESYFGNTLQLARSIADALAAHLDVTLVPVAEAPATLGPEIGLLVVGAPTQGLSLSRPGTRAEAIKQAGLARPAADVGTREWLDLLEPPSRPTLAACFDTRIRRPWLPGSAAAAASRRLQRMGFRMLVEPETFWVEHTAGPPLAHEADRAWQWGDALGAQLD